MPPTPRDWSGPFFLQARQDLDAAWALANSGAIAKTRATFCMLLQMVFEKVAKAAEYRSGNAPPRSHRIVEKLFVILERDRRGRGIVAAHAGAAAFVRQLEEAQPAVAGKVMGAPQLEYPWEAGGAVRWPGDDLPLARRVSNPKDLVALESLRLAEALIAQLPSIVP